MQTIDISHAEEIYTVSRLNRETRFLLEGSFAIIWVEGEISNFAAPQSGHWYFSLKDSASQVRCAMFRPQIRHLNFKPKDGMQVVIKTKVSLYEGRGDFQLLVEHIEEAGVGKLQKEFEALQKKLAAAGLFDSAIKKKLPTFPKTIGVITSTTGAAIKDILSVLKRRFRCVSIIIYPTLVQGEQAAANIVKALETANRRKECDVIILARGGGSLEDLWPFNDEAVAHAIYKSEIPLISGIGHEIDFTISDFVADIRAATPSAAAELVTPHIDELLSLLIKSKKHLIRLTQQQLDTFKQQLIWIQKNLEQQHPQRRLLEQQQRLDYYEMALVNLQSRLLTTLKSHIETVKEKLFAHTPKHMIRDIDNQLHLNHQYLLNMALNSLQNNQQTLNILAGKLDALSPLAILKRGFAIATRDRDQKILRDSKQVESGDRIHVKLMEGDISCEVL